MSKSALKRRAREARLWLTDACFPLWSERGIGEHGLFRETLGLDHQPEDSATTRVRVQARQTYVFAEAARLGWEPETAADHVAMGIAALTGPALRPDGLAGRTLETATGRLADDTADLYDNAFALFALAAAMGSGVEVNNLAPHGNALVTHLDTLMHAPDGGYAETLPPGPKRHQNPHMHLLEASLAWHRVDPGGGHLARAKEIVALFETRFTAGPGGLLGEHFAPGWALPEGRDADVVEPGHQFEWVWLLHEFARAADVPVPPAAEVLYAFACKTLDSEGRALMEVSRDGAVIDGSRRTWSQTEALKAHLARFAATGDERFAAAACLSFDVLMDEFLTPEGGWIDHYDAEGLPLARHMPASTGYHVVLAFADLLRVMDT